MDILIMLYVEELESMFVFCGMTLCQAQDQ